MCFGKHSVAEPGRRGMPQHSRHNATQKVGGCGKKTITTGARYARNNSEAAQLASRQLQRVLGPTHNNCQRTVWVRAPKLSQRATPHRQNMQSALTHHQTAHMHVQQRHMLPGKTTQEPTQVLSRCRESCGLQHITLKQRQPGSNQLGRSGHRFMPLPKIPRHNQVYVASTVHMCSALGHTTGQKKEPTALTHTCIYILLVQP